MVADFKDETQDVLSQVGEATDDFRTADRLESVPKLPEAVSDSVGSLVQRAREFRAKVGYETAVHDYKAETETVDALSAVDQVTRNIAGKDASAASARLTDFLKSNPEPGATTKTIMAVPHFDTAAVQPFGKGRQCPHAARGIVCRREQNE